MNYSKMYFGKELYELTYQDIEIFFKDEKQESDKIEFKSYYNHDEKTYTDKENGIIKAICGFLNSEGGLIIWGAPIGKSSENKKEKIFEGQLSPVAMRVEKDSFIRKASDLITPSPSGIKFHAIERDKHFIYVIEVEQSFYSPHQFRNVYYMRMDGQTKPAPHHFIEALFRKVTFPKLQGFLRVDAIRWQNNMVIMQITNYIFNKSKIQNETDIYYRILVTVGKFASFGKNIGTKKLYRMNGSELVVNSAKDTLYYNEPYSDSEIINFDYQELVKSNKEFEIHFYFAGKKSPLMFSRYTIEIDDEQIADIKSTFKNMEENVYAYAYSDSLNKSDPERMKSLLGR